MTKAILGVVIGYMALVAVMFGLMTVSWFAVGIDRVFQPGTFKIAGLWIALALVVMLVAGMAGGFVCSVISRNVRIVQILGAFVVVLATLVCIPAITADQTPKPRGADLKMMEAMQQGQAPIWMHLVSAALGGAGVLLGGRKP